MKRLTLALLFSFFSLSLSAQTVNTTVCDVLANPMAFDGKIVQIKGTVISGFDEFAIKDSSCNRAVNAIWLSYPEGTKGNAGPAALVELQLAQNSTGTVPVPNRVPVKLDKNADFKKFDSLLATPHRFAGLCLGCQQNTVTATMIGRLDAASSTGALRDASGKFISVNGFGNMNAYPARLVLQSVSDVSAQEIDYSKTKTFIGEEPTGKNARVGDPVSTARDAAKAFGNSPASAQIEQAAAAYGKQGDDNGVVIGFGIANELRKDDGLKRSRKSPDGLLFNCTFDSDRIKGNDALSKAIVHIGTHIADIRGNHPEIGNLEKEYRGWQTSVLTAIATRKKTFTLPGGFVAWDAQWPAAEQATRADEALSKYAASWSPFSR